MYSLLCPLCRLCKETFVSDEEAIRHSNDVHARKGEVRHQCYTCLQWFKTRTGYNKHRRVSHKPGKKKKKGVL